MSNYKQTLSSMEPGLYLGTDKKKGILVNDDKTFCIGTIKIKKDKYCYFQYRAGKKIIQRYIGKKRPGHWLTDGEYQL